MSKERLEEIKKNLDPLGYGMGGHLISVNDIYWLVEQAERVEELEDLSEHHLKMLKYCSDARKKYHRQNKRYREALEYIAAGIPVHSPIDYENKARKALEGDLE